jgi:hypothetical protein
MLTLICVNALLLLLLCVGIAQSVLRRVTGWTAQVWFLPGQAFSLLRSLQTGSGAHKASYPVGTGGDSPWLKWPGYEADHSSLSSV